MKQLLKVIIPLIIMSFFVAGCPKKDPNPNDTGMVVGDGTGAIGGGIDPELDTYGPDRNQGLDKRDGTTYTSQERGVLQSVFFAFDQSHVRPSERAKVDAASAYLLANPNSGILIEGHCDWRGTTEYNLGLGDRRASSIRSYLESLGISSSRIQVTSKGDLEATVNGSSSQMAHDRRADLVILK